MIKKRLGVNIDHVGTLRNVRDELYPDPLRAALVSQNSGADSITIHLREDRRHIRDYDLRNIKKKIKIPLNLEIAPTNEMTKIAIKYKKTPSPQPISKTLLSLGILKINFSNGHIHGLAHEKNFLNPYLLDHIC